MEVKDVQKNEPRYTIMTTHEKIIKLPDNPPPIEETSLIYKSKTYLQSSPQRNENTSRLSQNLDKTAVYAMKPAYFTMHSPIFDRDSIC